MADSRSRKPQVAVYLPSQKLRDDVIAIANAKGERDRMGTGLSVVVRKALENYRDKHLDWLPDDHAADPSP